MPKYVNISRGLVNRVKELVAAHPELESVQTVVQALAELAVERYREFLEGEPVEPRWGGSSIDSSTARKLKRIVLNSGLWGTTDELVRDILRDFVQGRISVEEVARRIRRG